MVDKKRRPIRRGKLYVLEFGQNAREIIPLFKRGSLWRVSKTCEYASFWVAETLLPNFFTGPLLAALSPNQSLREFPLT